MTSASSPARLPRARRWPRPGVGESVLVLLVLWCAAAWLGLVGGGHEELVGAPWEAPSLARPLGTDALGRDLAARVLAAGGPSITIGLAATTITLVVAGLATAFARLGRGFAFLVDVFADTVSSVPPLFALLATSLLLGIGVLPATIAIAFVAWPTPHRLLRASLDQLDAAPFVIASRLGGASAVSVFREHVGPRITRLCGTLAVSGFVWSVEAEGVLGWLGRSATTTPTWGRLVADGIDAMVRGAWLPLLGVAAPLVALAILGQAYVSRSERNTRAALPREL